MIIKNVSALILAREKINSSAGTRADIRKAWCLSALCGCDQRSEMKDLKGRKVYSESQFWRSGPWSLGPVAWTCSGAVHHGGREEQRRLFTLQQLQSKDRKGPGPQYPFKGTHKMTSPPPTQTYALKTLPPPNSDTGWGPMGLWGTL